MCSEYGCYSPDDRFLAIAPMCHGAGMLFSLAPVFLGGYAEIMDKFEPEQVMIKLKEEAMTGFFGVPTHFNVIFSLEQPFLQEQKPQSLKTVISNAAALPQAMKETLVEYFGPGILHETYGSTEAGIVLNLRPADQLRKKACVGQPIPGTLVSVRSDDGNECGPDEVGELFSKSPYLFNGYYKRPEETAEAYRDGWVTVGDMVRRDEEGYFYIVDRKKDMVISGGTNIYPREIEEVLITHPNLRDVAVIGVPDEKWGESLKAYVVGDVANPEQLIEFCGGKISAMKTPRQYEFVDAIPRNATGKVLKTELRKRDSEMRRMVATGTTTRRGFIAGAGAAVLSLKYGDPAFGQLVDAAPNVNWEDGMREKWTWDKVVHSTHGTNCSGNCAFNVYVKNGIVVREEQQGEYGKSDPDAPDYNPRGCQKGLCHAKYMYGDQRILYPMKRVGERGAGQWERVTWDEALADVADRFIDTCVEHGAESVTFGLGTQMLVKRASFASLGRFATISGSSLPEAFAGVGDLPTGVQMTVGKPIIGDSMAAVFKSKCCLVWYCNPAVTRLPDAHFFWEARYNGTEVIAISPEFTPTAMHASKWVNPKPGTDAALALAMAQVIIEDGTYDAGYLREQTDMPFLVRTDTRKFLRGTDFGEEDADQKFYWWDEDSGAVVPAPGTGFVAPPPGQPVPEHQQNLELDGRRPALEGTWTVDTPEGQVEVTTVFELSKAHAAGYTPELSHSITGVHPDVVTDIARTFAAADPAMIFCGYRVSKWLHGDLLQRSFMLLLSLTGNLGKPGGGLQIWSMPKEHEQLEFMFEGLPPTLRIATMSRWDYAHGNLKELNEEIYGAETAEHIDKYYQQSVKNGWFPDYSRKPWKMGFYMGSNSANWRASGKHFRENEFEKLEHIVAFATDMGVTPMYADYVFPVAQHYERHDMMLESRTPYIQVIDAAVPPLGESVDDFEVFNRLSRAIAERATERGVAPIDDLFMGVMPVKRDFTKFHELFTMGGKYTDIRQVLDHQISHNPGIPAQTYDELAKPGILRGRGSENTVYTAESVYEDTMLRSVVEKKPYRTLTGRQQYYIDHDWFLQEGEALPTHRDPLAVKGYPLRFLQGHARHGIHSMWRDAPLLVSLQRGEPDIYVNPNDATERGVEDGEMIRVYNSFGSFIVQAHVTSVIQPGMTFMYHGWDPMMFKGRQNFGAVVSTAGLIKPTSLVSGYGHITYKPLVFEPNATFQDVTCDFEKYVEA
jgi:DMSO reductase family type II enzyme molybdopterin subunit